MSGVRAAACVLAAAVIGSGTWWAVMAVRDPLGPGRAAYERGDWTRAAEVASRRLRKRPDDPEALTLLARSFGRLGRAGDARAIYARLGIEAMRAEDYLVVAAGFQGQGDVATLGRVLERARQAEPGHPGVLYELSRYNARVGRRSEAIELAGRLVDQPGWEVSGYVLLGLLRHDLPDPAGAAKALGQAFRLAPDLEGGRVGATEPIRKLLAGDLLRLGRSGEAEAQLRAILDAGLDRESSWLLSRARLQSGDASGAASALAEAADVREDEPQAHEPAPFVGSSQCAGCHSEIHHAQRASRHARTFWPADASLALPLPDGEVPDPAEPGARHSIRRDDDGRIRWETRVGGEAWHAVVEYAFGSGDHGLTPVGLDGEGRVRQMRLSHYGERPGWDLTTGLSPHPTDLHDLLGEPLAADGLRRCLGCHTTDSTAARDPGSPLAGERGISCERCHGPAGNHLAAVAVSFPDPAIGRPRLAGAAQVVELCASCHAPKGREVVSTDPAAVRFQGATLTWSRCYTESDGGLSCVTCHNPHRDAETAADHYESACLTCHGPPAVPGGNRRSTCPVNPADDCLSCHMPPVRGVVPHITFTDHHIRVHRDPEAAGE